MTYLSNVFFFLLYDKLWTHFVPELPEPAIKGLCKLFCLTPHRYRSDVTLQDVRNLCMPNDPELLIKMGHFFTFTLGMLHHDERSSPSLPYWLTVSLGP